MSRYGGVAATVSRVALHCDTKAGEGVGERLGTASLSILLQKARLKKSINVPETDLSGKTQTQRTGKRLSRAIWSSFNNERMLRICVTIQLKCEYPLLSVTRLLCLPDVVLSCNRSQTMGILDETQVAKP